MITSYASLRTSGILLVLLFCLASCSVSVNEHSDGENQYVQLKNETGKAITFTHFSADTASWLSKETEVRDGDTGHLFVRDLQGTELRFTLRYDGDRYSGSTGNIGTYYDYVLTIFKDGDELKCRTDKNDEVHLLQRE